MINKLKFFSWLKLWHQSRSSSSGESNSSTHHSNQGEQPIRHANAKYGKRDWMRNWNLLYLDKRSCAQTKDVYTANLQQQQQQGRGRSRLESASDHLAQSTAAMADHAAYLSIRSSSLDLDEKGKDSHSVVILLGHNQHYEGIADGETLRPNTATDTAKTEAMVLDVVPDTPGLELPQHKCSLKNKVLPLTMRDRVVVNNVASVQMTSTGNTKDASVTDPTNKSSDNALPALKTIVTRPETIRGTGSFCVKNIQSAKISLVESPNSARDIRWKRLLSHSRSGSPRSPSCLSQQGDWSREQRGRTHHQKGSHSTMGSPWNSRAGGNRSSVQRRSSFKSCYNQGQWITTDTDFVVLEL